MTRLCDFLGATALLVVAVLIATTSLAAAGDGLAISSDKTYTPDPEAGLVNVSATYVLTNVKPTEYFETYTRSYWFESFSFAVLAEATDVVVTAGGRPLTVTREPIIDETTFEIVDIRLPRNLNYQQTITLEASWVLPSGAVRDEAIVRVSPSYITFPVIACCDPGAANVQIAIPNGFDVELLGERGDQLTVAYEDGEHRLEAREIEDPGEFVATMFARNDDGLVTDVVRFGASTAEVRSWPDDPEWADFVADTIENDLPVLEDLIGVPWPLDETLVVVETVSPYLEGYGGTYSDGVIEIGENLDEKIVLHELSHAWLNGDLSDERWIIEGLAEEFASRTLAATNPDGDLPVELAESLAPRRPDPTSVVARPLQEWPYAAQLRGREDQPEVEKYHYNASWWVMRGISDEIGIDGLADVVDAVLDRKIPFAGDNDEEVLTGPITAERFLDTVEQLGGSETANQLLVDHVFNRSTIDELAEREAALASYELLTAQSGDWAAPLGVRQQLTRWEFETAVELTDLAIDALADQRRNATLASELGVALSVDTEERFESARFVSDFANLEKLASDEFEQLEQIDARREALEDTALGLSTATPPWEEQSTADDALAAIDDRTRTLDVLAAATTAVSAERSLVTQVGLLGEDPARQLRNAQQAFARDDRAEAIGQAEAATELIVDARDVGRNRLISAAIGVGILALAVIAVLTTRRYRRRTTRAA